MSHSLVRRGLDLFRDDLVEQSSASGGPKKTKKGKEAALIAAVGTNKIGFRRKCDRMQKKDKSLSLKNKKISKSAKTTYSEFKKRDSTADNIRAIRCINLIDNNMKSQGRVTEKYMKKKRTQDEKAMTKEKDNVESVFTEADFRNFFNEFQFSDIARQKHDEETDREKSDSIEPNEVESHDNDKCDEDE